MESKLWTRNFILNFITNLFVYLVYYLLVVTSASYAMDSLHASTSEAGLAAGLFVLGALFARLAAGRMVGKIGFKKTLFWGLCFYFVTSCLYFFVSGLFVFFAVRFIHGMGFGVSATGTGTIAARIIPKDRQGEGVSYFALSTTMASAIGPLVGMNLLQRSTFTSIFFVCLALVALSLFASIGIRVHTLGAPESTTTSHQKLTIHNFIEKKALPISFICVLIVIAYSSVLAFLPKFAQSTQDSGMLAASSVFFLVYSLSVLVTRPITGRIFDRRGANIIMYPAILLFSAGLFVLWLAYHGFVLLCAAVLIGVGYGTFFSCANAIAIKVSPPERVHLATSTYYMMADFGAGVGPFLLGLMIPTLLSFRGLYLAMAVFVLLIVLLYYIAHGRKAQAPDVQKPSSFPT